MEIINSIIQNLGIISIVIGILYTANQWFKEWKLDKKQQKEKRYNKENQIENDLIEMKKEVEIFKEISLRIWDKIL